MASSSLDYARQEAANHIAQNARYVARRTPLSAIIGAGLRRRRIQSLETCFVEAAMLQRYPGNLLSELYRVQFEDAIDEAVTVCLSMSRDDCITLALAQNTAEARNVNLLAEAQALKAKALKATPAPLEPPTTPGTGHLDFVTFQRQVRDVLPDTRPATPAEQRALRTASTRAERRPREDVTVTIIEADTPTACPDFPPMSAEARERLDRWVMATKHVMSRGALLVYVGIQWPIANSGRATTDAERIQQYVAAIWPTYAAARGLPV